MHLLLNTLIDLCCSLLDFPPTLTCPVPLINKRSTGYSKSYVTKVPLKYVPGFHKARPFRSSTVDQTGPQTPQHTRSVTLFFSNVSAHEDLATGPAIPIVDDDLVSQSPVIVGSDSRFSSQALLHLHGADFDYCMFRERSKSIQV